MRNIKEIGQKEVVLCTTVEESKQFELFLDRNGYKWADGDSYLFHSTSNQNVGENCYLVSKGKYSPRSFYEPRGYRIIPASEFLEEEIKVGDMVVVTERFDINEAEVGMKATVVQIDKNHPVKYQVALIDKNNMKSWCKNVRKEVQEEIDPEYFGFRVGDYIQATDGGWNHAGYPGYNSNEAFAPGRDPQRIVKIERFDGVMVAVGDRMGVARIEEWPTKFIKHNHLKQNTTMTTQSITREGLKEIHSIACSEWKGKIAEYALRTPLENTVTFTDKEVEAMFKAATSSQLPVLKKYFKQEVEFTANLLHIGEMMEVTQAGEHQGQTLLRTYSQTVSLTNPRATWSESNCQLKGKKLERGSTFTITAQ